MKCVTQRCNAVHFSFQLTNWNLIIVLAELTTLYSCVVAKEITLCLLHKLCTTSKSSTLFNYSISFPPCSFKPNVNTKKLQHCQHFQGEKLLLLPLCHYYSLFSRCGSSLQFSIVWLATHFLFLNVHSRIYYILQ